MRFVFIAGCLIAHSPLAAADTYRLDADRWASPRSGAAIAQMEPVRRAVQELARTPGSMLQLRYPGDEAGELWGQELRAWLIALGIGAERIELAPAAAQAEAVELVVTHR